MRRSLFFILVLFTFNLAVANNDMPKATSAISKTDQSVTKSKLYPNPAVDFTIIKNSSPARMKNISVLSMVGSSLITKEVLDSNPTQQINVSKLPSGRFFVKVSYVDGSSEVLNLIKL